MIAEPTIREALNCPTAEELAKLTAERDAANALKAAQSQVKYWDEVVSVAKTRKDTRSIKIATDYLYHAKLTLLRLEVGR